MGISTSSWQTLRGCVVGRTRFSRPQNGVEVSLASKSEGKGFFLPFLGEAQAVKGVRHGDVVDFALPEISKGGVFWYEP
jgi:hypothetical protein